MTKIGIYDNERGSTLLALARAGMLPTRKYRSKFRRIQSHCLRCGMEDETTQYVLLECTPHHFNEEELPKKLGLLEELGRGEVGKAKELLLRWERETRVICREIAPATKGYDQVYII